MNETLSDKSQIVPSKANSVTVQLGKPISYGDDELTQLIFRLPTIDDLADIGYPFSVSNEDGETRIDIKPKTILKYASRLAALPPSALKTMALSDFMQVQTEIMGFFGDLGETPPI